MSSSSTQSKTLQTFLTAWKSWDAEGMLSTFSKETYTHLVLPKSLNVPPQSRADMEAGIHHLTAAISNHNLTIHHVLDTPEQNLAAVYANATADTEFGGKGDFKNEYAIFLTFSENGEQIVKMEEVVDAGFVKEWFPKFQGWLQETGKA